MVFHSKWYECLPIVVISFHECFPWIDILHINWPTRAHLSHLEALTLEQPPRVGVDLYSFSVGVELIQYIWRIRMLKHERYRTEHFTLALCISIYCINSGGWCGYKFVQFHCCLPLAVYLSISHKLKYIYLSIDVVRVRETRISKQSNDRKRKCSAQTHTTRCWLSNAKLGYAKGSNRTVKFRFDEWRQCVWSVYHHHRD